MKKIQRQESGQTMIEYIIIMLIVSIPTFLIFSLAGDSVTGFWQNNVMQKFDPEYQAPVDNTRASSDKIAAVKEPEKTALKPAAAQNIDLSPYDKKLLAQQEANFPDSSAWFGNRVEFEKQLAFILPKDSLVESSNNLGNDEFYAKWDETNYILCQGPSNNATCIEHDLRLGIRTSTGNIKELL